MDIQTSSGQPGSFSRVGTTPPSWFQANRSLAIRLSVIGAVVLLVVLCGVLFATHRGDQAQAALNGAMDVYEAPLQQAGQPLPPNTKSYASAAERAKVAYPLFLKVADQYGMTKAGANARYFAGLTAQDAGNSSAAESNLKKVADSSNSSLAALGKMALASLYDGTGRHADAAKLYQDVIDHPTLTVSANAARLALASSQESTNPQAARELYAKVKDSDKLTAAGQIASQKLSGK